MTSHPRSALLAVLPIFAVGALAVPTSSAVAPGGPDVGVTRVLVRALAHDAKVIGGGMGGVRIAVRDVETGELLAEGVADGGTGDTGAIMNERPRRGAFGRDGTAGFTAELDLVRPTLVDVTASGPLGYDTRTSATKRLWLVPGEDVLGDGLVLELNGLVVDLLDAGPASGLDVPVRARVVMLCGCPTEPGGMWDADEIRIVARLLDGDEVVAEAALAFAGETSTYAGTVEAPKAGAYRLEVLALQPAAANFGRAARDVTLAGR